METTSPILYASPAPPVAAADELPADELLAAVVGAGALDELDAALDDAADDEADDDAGALVGAVVGFGAAVGGTAVGGTGVAAGEHAATATRIKRLAAVVSKTCRTFISAPPCLDASLPKRRAYVPVRKKLHHLLLSITRMALPGARGSVPAAANWGATDKPA